ncbi:Cordon-bleu protein-like 1, partial [Buceros rhinoceros silvestris]
KSKAPPPPSETKPAAVAAFDDTESANLIMEQKENVIDKDIELSVVLPGDVIKCTTVNGRKPMMDLLIFLCAQYHLNPSSYTIELVSAENSQIRFKPNTPVGMLEVEKVIVKPKQMDKKKPAPVIPEQTVRVVINYKRTQKTVVRVSPHSPLQELIPIISSKCEFDPSRTLLLKNYQSQEPLDVTKSLNDLGLRELYAMDISRDSYQSENLDVLKEKENKGFFSFFQRSKKKREQVSAPATPLMSKPRPTPIMRSNTVSKQYDSNTLPSEMPKKRRAPLPPMPNSQSAPQELAQAQVRPASGTVKSNSLDRIEQAPPGFVRKGSLPLSDTASVSSSLRRMKRKAPSPPSRGPEEQSESSTETVTESTGSAPTKVEERPTEMQSEAGVKSSEYNLEEIDEREEMSVQLREDSKSTNTSLGIGEVTAAFSPAEVPLVTEKSDPSSSAPVPGSVSVDNSQSLKEEKQENTSTDGKGLRSKISSEQAAFEKDRKFRILDQNKTNDYSDTKLPTTEGKELQTAEIKPVDCTESNKLEVDRLSNCQACKNDISVSHRNYPQLISEKQDQITNQTSLDTVKTQDVAIQTGPSDSDLGRTAQKKIFVSQGCESSPFRGLVPQHNTDANNPLLQVMHGIKDDEDTSREENLKRQAVTCEKAIPLRDWSHICINGTNNNFGSPETTAKTPDGSPVKDHSYYRQDTKPKPKPANEITRDYIPKIGLTTFKIVPPKSLEIMKSWESEIPSDHKDQEVSTSENSLKHKDSKEFLVQAASPHLPKSTGNFQVASQNEPAAANDLLHRVNSISERVTSGAEITTESNRTETESSKQHVPLMLSLDNTNASSETQDKSNVLSPTTKPSSFYLQMQRRASGHYVTSAIARSTVCTPNSIQSETKSTEMGKKISSPDPTSLSVHKTGTSSPPADEEKVDDGKKMEPSTSPVKSNKLSGFPSCPPAPLNLRTLRTFGVPKPYSSSRPSPFALAVSSAVKRSQSFNKTRTITKFSSATAAEFSSATSVPQVKNPSLQTVTGASQNSLMDKKGNNVNSEQKCQVPSGASTDHPPPVTKRQTAMTFQRSDPEQIHQSLLAAIRSGEAAAKLKRV